RRGAQWAAVLPRGEERPQPPPLLLFGAVGDDGGRPHAVSDDVARLVGAGHTGFVEALMDEGLEGRRHAEPAVAGREVHPGEAGVELGTPERGLVRWV